MRTTFILPTIALLIASPAGAAPPATFEAAPFWASQENLGVGGMAFGDANDDGKLDLGLATYSGSSTPTDDATKIFYNVGGTLETVPSFSSQDIRWSTDAIWGLISDAARPDLLIINGGASAPPAVLYKQGPSGLSDTGVPFAPPAERSGLGAALADVNGDGHLDVFVANHCVLCDQTRNSGYLSAGGALPKQPSWLSENLGQFAAASFGDADRSGVVRKTFVATGDGSRALFWLPGSSLHAIHRVLVDGKAPGRVTYDLEQGYISLATPPASGATVAVLYEISLHPELAVAGNPGGVMVYPYANQSLSKTPSFSALATAGFKAIAWVDLDLDGYQELFAAGSSASPAVVFGNNAGTLSKAPIWESDNKKFAAQDAVISDINGDGFPDVLMVAFAATPVVRVLINHEGQLEKVPSFTIKWGGSSVGAGGAGDVDGDAMPDLAIGYASKPVQLYRNTTTGPAAPGVAGAAPSTGGVGQMITVTGSGFRAPMRAYLGDVALDDVTVVSATELTAKVSAFAVDGSYDLIIVAPDLQAAVLTGAFTVSGNPTAPDGGPAPDLGVPDAALPDATLTDAGPVTDAAPAADSGAADQGAPADAAAADGGAAVDAAADGGTSDASTGGGGCSCEISAASQTGWLLVVGLLAASLGRRRRRR